MSARLCAARIVVKDLNCEVEKGSTSDRSVVNQVSRLGIGDVYKQHEIDLLDRINADSAVKSSVRGISQTGVTWRAMSADRC